MSKLSSMNQMTSECEMQEIELFESSKERADYDNLADLYAIILATEHLERAYARDAITQKEVRENEFCFCSFLLKKKKKGAEGFDHFSISTILCNVRTNSMSQMYFVFYFISSHDIVPV